MIKEQLLEELQAYTDRNGTKKSWFKDSYSVAGEELLCIKMKDIRTVAKNNAHLSLADINTLFDTKYHDSKILACVLLVNKYQQKGCTPQQKREIVDYYLEHTTLMDNWDLVSSQLTRL